MVTAINKLATLPLSANGSIAANDAASRSTADRLYPRNSSPALDLALFRKPTAEYRGTPFWSWNNKLNVNQLLRQIDQLREMGFGGFHIHSRTGMATEYLGDEFMAAVRACAEKAVKEKMLCWLYDEDRWPSGFAGGLVTKDKQYRCKHLLWTTRPYSGQVTTACQDERAAGTRSENGELLARYDIVLSDGRLAGYRRMKPNEPVEAAQGTVWYAYLETCQESSWFNHQTYVDTMNPKAIQRFVEVTHERYKQTVGDLFGTTVPAIFTDEPQFPKKTTLQRANDQTDVIIPFTVDFLETYRATYGQDLLEHLPELFWELPDGEASVARYRYHDHTAERFASAYGDTIGVWCEKNGIALTGHMLGEPNLFSQTRALGEAMRPLRSFQIPGIDMLCDRMELTTAKQAQSVARQYGRPGVLSELYGVTNWDFDFAGHKRQGDWQAALGVTVRVPHLAWVSMAGESKRDYPAAIGYQSPWYKEYPLVEEHFSRLNTVLTRGKPHVRVGVFHPVESYWLCFGPVDQCQPEMTEREDNFRHITEWLSFGLIDFDFISEGLLPSQAPDGQDGKQFKVGQMRYDAIILPAMRTIRSTTLSQLTQYMAAGGTIIFAGEIPSRVDAIRSDAPAELAKHCIQVPFVRRRILEALEGCRDIEVRLADGTPSDTILYQMRADHGVRHLFLCNTDKEQAFNGARVIVRGHWDVTLLDTITGDIRDLHSRVDGDFTVIDWHIAAHGHLLVTLSPRSGAATPRLEAQPHWEADGVIADTVPVTLSEPNVLLLDQAEWRIGEGTWNDVEEVLRLENKARELLNLPARVGRIAQPWTDKEHAPIVATLQLRFTIHSDVDVKSLQLAMENPEHTRIKFDGEEVPSTVTGWWVDEAIKTVAMPSFSAGEHEILLTIPMTRKTDVEWCYLLGDFGVKVSGRSAKIVAPVRELAFGDWTSQGLPFYAGNVTYHCTITGDGRELKINVPKYRNPLVTVDLDGRRVGQIAFAPNEVVLGRLTGTHMVDLTAFGNRVNAFGPVHNAHENLSWVGPAAWRSVEDHWAYTYQLKRTGILVTPQLFVRK